MGCGDVCLLNDEGYRAIERSSHPPLINLTVPPIQVRGERRDLRMSWGHGRQCHAHDSTLPRIHHFRLLSASTAGRRSNPETPRRSIF